MFTAVSEVAAVLTAQRAADKAMKQANSMALLPALTDMRQQVERLVFPGFVAVAGLDRLRRIRVYLRGVEARVQKLLQNPGRDATWMREVTVATDRYTDAGGVFPPSVGAHAELVHARWMLEEFRLSLFAQELGTAETVSLQRITKTLAAAR
jgi:ATP-dependent helicase HrpA